MAVNRLVTKIDGQVVDDQTFQSTIPALPTGAHTVTVEAYNGSTLVSSQTRNFTVESAVVVMPKAANLIRFYKFNETTGDAIDETGNQDGVVYGGMTRNGSSYIGNGTNAYVNAGLTGETTEFTLALKIDPVAQAIVLGKFISASKRIMLNYEDGTRRIWFTLNSYQNGGYAVIPQGDVPSLVFTAKSGGRLKIYFNKELVSDVSAPTFSSVDTELTLLRYSGSSYGVASLDYFAMWDMELSQTDINDMPDGSL